MLLSYFRAGSGEHQVTLLMQCVPFAVVVIQFLRGFLSEFNRSLTNHLLVFRKALHETRVGCVVVKVGREI